MSPGPDRLTKLFYIFVARLDDDTGLTDNRLKQHAHLMRQEIQGQYDQDMDQYLPKERLPK